MVFFIGTVYKASLKCLQEKYRLNKYEIKSHLINRLKKQCNSLL